MDFLKDLIATRGVQLIARYAGVGLVALGTKLSVELTPDQVSNTSSAVAAFVAAGICALIDHFSHAKQADEK
jgi:hypothetical protein